MKIAAIAVAATLAVTAAQAAEIGNTGISLGGTVDANYTTGLDTYAVEFTPRAGYSAFGVAFGVESTFDVMDLNNGEPFKGLDFDASYDLMNTGAKVYGEVGTDKDFEFGDVKVGVSFSF